MLARIAAPVLQAGLGFHLGRALSTTATAACAAQRNDSAQTSTQQGGKIGFIGLGKMGAGMLANLVKAGHQVVVFDSNSIAVDRALALSDGVEAASTPAEVVSKPGVGVLFTMLPTPAAVHDVYLGSSGVLAAKGGPMASLMVDCSTVEPPLARKIAAAAERVKLNPDATPVPGLEEEDTPVLVDAPVTGGVVLAAKGSLSFMVGCDEEALPVVKPYLLKMGQNVTYCGGHGNGQTAKLCNALALAGTMAATSEALALARRLGVDPKVMTAVLNSGAGHSWISENYNPVPGICPESPPSHGFKAGLSVDGMIAQLDMVVRAGEHSHSPVPVARYINNELFSKVRSEGLGDKDFSSIYRYYYGLGNTCEQWQSGEKLFNTHAP